MFDAGSAVFTLTGRVVREPFDSYGKLVEGARANKEHQIVLGADTQSTGFDKFNAWLDKTKQNIRDFAVTAKGQLDGVSASTDKMASAADRGLQTVRDSLSKTSEEFVGVGDSAKETSTVVTDEQAKMQETVAKTADEYKASADSIVRSNERIAESGKAAGGGGGGRGTGIGGAGAGGAGGTPEQQAQKTNSAWKESLGTLTNVGKWATVALGAIGVVSVKWAADFQRQMELVHTQAGYTQKEVDDLTKSVRDLAPAVGIGPAKLAEALFHIASSGIPAAHAMDVLKLASEGAKVGNADLESVTNALVAIWKTAPKDISSVSEAMGVMNDIVGRGNMRMQDLTGAMTTGILPAAKAVGLGLRDVGAALDVMTSRGVPAQEGATRLRTVLSLIANPTTKAQKALDELGFAHDRLATDFRQHGLVYALQDLQDAMSKVFGHKLDYQQEQQALMAYGQQLQDAGASTNAIRKALVQYKQELDTTGDGATKASQLIATAFGGARMGTTMQILMQNIDDVRSHFDTLNQAGAAQRFQSDWQATQKDFSVQASQMWAGVQRLGIALGDFLIPKIKDTVKWLIEAGKWLGKHKALADLLAVAFGTLLVGAIAAFFGKLVLGAARGLISIGKLGKAIFDLPQAMGTATEKMVAWADKQKAALADVQAQAETTDASMQDMGASGGVVAGEGGGGGVLEEAGGAGGLIEGMITGVRGTTAPGSQMNPLAVVVMASEAFGLSQGAASEAKAYSATSGGQVAYSRPAGAQPISRTTSVLSAGQTPEEIQAAESTGGKTAADEIIAAHQEGGRLAGAEIATAEEAGGIKAGGIIAGEETAGGAGGGIMGGLSKAKTGIKSAAADATSSIGGVFADIGPKLMKAGMGTLLAQTLGSTISGGIGHAVSTIGTAASLGSMFGPWGTALGAALGVGLTVFSDHAKSDGAKWADSFTSTLPGKISAATKQGLQHAGDLPIPASPTARPGQRPSNVTGSPPPSVERSGGSSSGQVAPIPGVVITPPAQALQQRKDMTGGLPDPTAEKKSIDDALAVYRREFDAQFNAMFVAANDYGKKSGNAWVEAMQSVKFPTEWSMLNSAETQLDNVPKNVKAAGDEAVKVWQNSAAQQMVEYSTTLEQKGQLPKGSTDQLIASLEQKYKGLGAFLDAQGEASEKTVAKHMQNVQARTNLIGFLNDVRKQWGLQWSYSQTSTDNFIQNTATSMEDLRQLMKSKNKTIHDEAVAEYKKLTQDLNASMAEMLSNASTSFSSITNAVSSNTKNAMSVGGANFQALMKNIAAYVGSGAEATQKGLKEITDEVNGILRSFHEAPLAAVTVRNLSPAQLAAVVSGQVSSGAAASLHATGGILPGAEFGMGDVMTLVDPMGNPRARMAGDEAVFNRHQMPYVEAGLQMLGFGGAQDLWSQVNTPHGVGFAKGGSLNRLQFLNTGGYLFPFGNASVTWERSDQGVDFSMPSGTPIGPMGDSQVVNTIPNWYAGQPLIWWKLLNGPRAGKYAYVAEQITNLARPGQLVKANQAVADFASSGTGIEYGWATSSGETLARATSGYTEGQVTPAGSDMRSFLQGLSHGVIVGGSGSLGGMNIPVLKAPGVEGKGFLKNMVSSALKKSVDAANKYLQSHLSGVGSVGALSGPVEKQIYEAFSQLGYNKTAIAGIIGNAYQESSLDPSAYGGGAAGLWQWTPPSGLLDYAGAIHQPWQNVGVQSQLVAKTLGASGRSAINATGSPSAAASWFMNNFERPGIPELQHRIDAANQAYSAGYAGGGYLPGFAGGGGRVSHSSRSGSPWGALPGGLGHLPGYRPVRVRRGTGGLHTVGGGKGAGRAGKGGAKGSSGASGGGQQSRKHQTLSQAVADQLKKLGFGNWDQWQTDLGNLDTKYTNQENLFNLFDTTSGGGTGLTKNDLDNLMGIREQEFDILYYEYQHLPALVKQFQNKVTTLTGTEGHPAYTTTVREQKGKHSGGFRQTKGSKPSTHKVHHPAVLPSGVAGLTKEVQDTEDDITSLEYQSMQYSQAIADVHHNVTAEVMAATDQYARELSGFLTYLNNAHEQLYKNSQQRIKLHQELRNITAAGKSTPTLGSIVTGVMGGDTGTSTTTSASTKQRQAIEDHISSLQSQDLTIQENAYQVRQEMHSLLLQREADARAYREQGFNAAWAIQLKKYKIQDEIFKLRQTLKNLKASLKTENTELSKDQKVLDTLQGWESGGLQGGQSVSDSLESIVYDMFDLYQQGASLPTSGADDGYAGKTYWGKPRTTPTLKSLEALLTKMGLTVPPGLVSGTGTTTATQTLADFTAFQASRAALYQQFGSNFAPAGASGPMGAGTSSAAGGAGVQFFGAAAGSAAGAGSPGGSAGQGLERGGYVPRGTGPGAGDTTINIEQNFAAGPPDPHTWSAGVTHELGAMV